MKRPAKPHEVKKILQHLGRQKAPAPTQEEPPAAPVAAPVGPQVVQPTPEPLLVAVPPEASPLVEMKSTSPLNKTKAPPTPTPATPQEDYMPTAGIVANDQNAATTNSNIIEAALLNYSDVSLPNGTIYVNRTMKTSDRVGCGRINTNASYGYKLGGHPTMTGGMCRIVMLGATPVPVFRLRGTGFFSEDPLEIVGNGGAGFEIEGHVYPATGRHRFANICFTTCSFAFDALKGYYDGSGNLVEDQNHGDNSVVRNCETFTCKGLFRSDNEQAVNWIFRDCMVNSDALVQDFTVCHIKRGGCVHLERLVIEEPQCTIFEVEKFSPNNCRLVCEDFYFDRMVSPTTYLRLFKYSGDPVAAAWSKWFLKVNGFMQQYQIPANLYSIPANLPKDYFEVDIKDLYTS